MGYCHMKFGQLWPCSIKTTTTNVPVPDVPANVTRLDFLVCGWLKKRKTLDLLEIVVVVGDGTSEDCGDGMDEAMGVPLPDGIFST